MSEHQKDAIKRAEFGIEVEAFIRGEIGTFLLDRLKAEASAATEDLKTIDPSDTVGILKRQLVIERAENIEGWLAGIIQEGWHAEEQLTQEEI